MGGQALVMSGPRAATMRPSEPTACACPPNSRMHRSGRTVYSPTPPSDVSHPCPGTPRKARCMTHAIDAEGLVKIYRSRKNEVRALDGVDLTVDEGTVLGLLGPNGAGKTTTVRILATLLKPDAGRASVAGFDVVHDAQTDPLAHRPVGPVRRGRREPDRPREPLDVRAPLPAAEPRVEAARRRAPRAVRAVGRGRSRREDVLGRHAAPARPRERAHRPPAAAVPRRADDRPRPAQPPRDVGRDPRAWSARARRCCSRPSTSRRPTSWPTRSPSSTTARSSRAARRTS